MVQLMQLPSHHLLLHENAEWFIFLVLSYLGCPGNRLLNKCLVHSKMIVTVCYRRLMKNRACCICHCRYYHWLLYISVRTILPLVERNSWQSSKHLEASVKRDPVDPKDEKLQVWFLWLSVADFLVVTMIDYMVLPKVIKIRFIYVEVITSQRWDGVYLDLCGFFSCMMNFVVCVANVCNSVYW